MNAPDEHTPIVPRSVKPVTVTSDAAPQNDSEGTKLQSGLSSFLAPPGGLPVVPGFVLLAEIGRGGMGVIYRARDAALQRNVAIKVLQDRYPPAGAAARRFVEEAQITAQLQHPGIPPIHHVGALADGRPFLVMKLIKGDTLDKLLKARPTPGDDRGRFLAIFEQICQAVGYAHAHDVVHRDLKPSNVMVGAFGEVQVMDWGLSKSIRDPRPTETRTEVEEAPRTEIGALRDADSATQTGSVMGTPAFMPPEQAGGEIAKIDYRSDVFSLGAVLCVLLTGQPPYVGGRGDDVQLMAIRAELGDALARLDACGAEPELVALCKQCLAAKRDARPKDAHELAAAVADFRSAAEERARQAELERVRAEGARAVAEARAAEQRKKRKVQLALFATVALLVAAGGGFAWYLERQAGAQKLKDELAEAERKAELQRVDAERKADLQRAEAERKAELQRVDAARKEREAELKGEADAERRFKAEQARQGVKANLKLAADLREQYKFKEADTALVQAAALAKTGAPELLREVEQARADLAFVVQLDDIRFRKWIWVTEPGYRGHFNTVIAAPGYRKAFARYGPDLPVLAPAEAARRIASSGVRSELVAAVDDWALHEPDEALRDRLLEIARKADPGRWTDRLRTPDVWKDRTALAKLAAETDLATVSPPSLSVLAELMRRSGLDPEPLLTRARAIHPSNFELAFCLGLRQGESRRDGRQIGPYEAARAIRPENLAVWNNLGTALVGRGDFDGAIAVYNKVIELDPKVHQVHSNLGSALSSKGDFDKAIAACKKAIEIAPEYAPAYCNLGVALGSKGDLEGAADACKTAIALNPRMAHAHNNLGVVYLQQKKYPEAIACARAAIEIEPAFSNAHAMLGDLLFRTGDIRGARAALTEAARLDSRWQPMLAKLPPVAPLPVAPPPHEVNRP
jgi:tetratricopeptide (TPR) repeat protein